MRIVAVEDLIPGQLLARSVYGQDGRVMLAKGMALKDRYIERVKELGYAYVYIVDPADTEEDLVDSGPISEETKMQAVKCLKDVVADIKSNRSYDDAKVTGVVDVIIDEILSNPDVVYSMMDIRSYDNYTYMHSVSVCVLSILLGVEKGLNRFQLQDLGVGAILHDIGKMLIPPEILNKHGSLTAEEFEVVKLHTKKGFDILRKMRNISLYSAHVAFQHHERLDGSGYPRRLKGDEIHDFGKIVSIADSHDAMTSDRVYRRALMAHESVVILARESGTKYDSYLVNLFFRAIAMYPIGSTLRLSDGRVCRVVYVSKKALIVRILSGEDEGQRINLYDFPEIRILRRIQ